MIRIMMAATTTISTTISTTNSIRSRTRNQCRIHGQQWCGGDINNHGRFNFWFRRRRRRRHRNDVVGIRYVFVFFLNWGGGVCFPTLFVVCCKGLLPGKMDFSTFYTRYNTHKQRANDEMTK
jgi:hypothetical protein